MMIEHVVVTELVLTVELCISEKESKFSILVVKVTKSFIRFNLVFCPFFNTSLGHNNNKPGLIYCQSWQTRVSVRVHDAG